MAKVYRIIAIIALTTISALFSVGITPTLAHAALPVRHIVPISRYHQTPTIEHRLPVRQYK